MSSSRNKFLTLLLLLISGFWIAVGYSDPGTDQAAKVSGYVVRIRQNSPMEVEAALRRADELFQQGKFRAGFPPVAFVLHGPEANIFFSGNYQAYKSIVDLAARLSAFKIVDIKVCKTYLKATGNDDKPLPPFVGTVDFWETEMNLLIDKKGYSEF